MSYEAKGIIEKIFDVQQVSDKFRKQEFVLEMQNGEYKEYPKFQFIGDKCAKLDAFAEGMEVLVKFNLKGKPFEKNGEKMYFNNLDAWHIESNGNAPKSQPEPTPNHYTPKPVPKPETHVFVAPEDDLPF